MKSDRSGKPERTLVEIAVSEQGSAAEQSPGPWEGTRQTGECHGATDARVVRNRKVDFVVVGAGVAGLTIAYRLLQRGWSVLVVEKESRVGGLARSLYYHHDGQEFIFDLGPKIFHSNDEEVRGLIFEVLEGHYNTFERKCSLYHFDTYFNWPLRATEFHKLPVGLLCRVCGDVLKKLLLRSPPPSTNLFPDYIRSEYGRTLYELFFKDYTEKFTCSRADDIHSDWANAAMKSSVNEDRAKKFSILKLARMALLPSPTKLEAFYPSRGGFGIFPEALANKIVSLGGEIQTSYCIDRIDPECALFASQGCEIVQFDQLVWTGNLNDLTRLMGEASSAFNYTATVFFNIILKGQVPRKDLWLHFGDPGLTILRVSIMNNFGSHLVPNGYFALCVEKRCLVDDTVWRDPESLIDRVLGELIAVGLMENKTQAKKVFVERIRDTYPVYDLEHRERFPRVESSVLGRCPKIALLGRTGIYWYNNANHSIKMALEMAKYFSGERQTMPDRKEMLFAVKSSF